MKQLINIPQEGIDDNPSRSTSEITRESLAYLLQLFHAGLEGRHGVRLTIQCLDSGAFRGTITAVVDVGKPTELGLITFTNNESVDGVFEYFEEGLTYGDLTWRVDKFWKKEWAQDPEPPKKRVRVPKRL